LGKTKEVKKKKRKFGTGGEYKLGRERHARQEGSSTGNRQEKSARNWKRKKPWNGLIKKKKAEKHYGRLPMGKQRQRFLGEFH